MTILQQILDGTWDDKETTIQCQSGHLELGRSLYGGLILLFSPRKKQKQMAEGNPPYHTFKPLKALFLTATKGAAPLKKADKWSDTLKDFLNHGCFELDPQKRSSSAELLEVSCCSWFFSRWHFSFKSTLSSSLLVTRRTWWRHSSWFSSWESLLVCKRIPPFSGRIQSTDPPT